MLLSGLNIVPHSLAREVRTEYRVTRWAAGKDKKRKNWRVMRVEINKPGAYQIGNTIYMHPELVEKLRALPPNGRDNRPREAAKKSEAFCRSG